VKVIDLSRGIAGAYCAQLLALAGCEVVRLDVDGRDERVDAVAWECANRGKREIGVAAAEIPEHLADAAAVVEDRGPGGLEALGLDGQRCVAPTSAWCSRA
jgi:crotonobetainyl-CoA:carnitine CoA-transferase CaiB-like acyl-CoA transferase